VAGRTTGGQIAAQKRNLPYSHTLRYPVMMIMSLGVPVLLLLLFVGVFGGALNAGLGDRSHGGAYIDYLVPGIVLMTVGYGSSTTALAVNRDMTEGIIADSVPWRSAGPRC
jgi:ABC-2 type transport system permease protein